MSRLVFFLLVIANVAFGIHLWLSGGGDKGDFSVRERNRDEVRLVAVTPPLIAARKAEETRLAVQRLAGAACVEFAGVVSADLPRARAAFAAFKLGDRMLERRLEDITRYWVFVPTRDRKGAEAAVSQMRRQGVSDLSIRPDNAVSLGVFSTEEAARRYLAAVEAKGVKDAQYGAFSKELREITFLIRDPDTEMVARLAILQRDYSGSHLRAVSCPA